MSHPKPLEPEHPGEPQRQCRKCGEWRPLSHYARKGNPWCHLCRRLYQREYTRRGRKFQPKTEDIIAADRDPKSDAQVRARNE